MALYLDVRDGGIQRLYEARGALPRRRPDGPEPDNIPAWEKG